MGQSRRRWRTFSSPSIACIAEKERPEARSEELRCIVLLLRPPERQCGTSAREWPTSSAPGGCCMLSVSSMIAFMPPTADSCPEWPETCTRCYLCCMTTSGGAAGGW